MDNSSSSDEFSDSALDDSEEFEDSMVEPGKKRESELKNQPYDMELEVSASLDVASSKDLMGTGMANLAGRNSEGTRVANAPHDEEFEVSASMAESQLGVDMSKLNKNPPKGKMENQPFDEEVTVSEDEASIDTTLLKKRNESKNSQLEAAAAPNARQQQKELQAKQALAQDDDESEESSSSSSDENEESTPTVKVEGAYDPSDYVSLNVAPEVRELFQYISRFKPQEPELETVLKPFIPDYIPSVGEMDVFLKVSRPDDTQDEAGLKVLDEPASTQSDATVLELQLRAISKKQHGDIAVRSIEDAHKNPDQIQKWITNISDLHRSKPPPQVHYKNSMPDIETLMEIWPDEFEEALGSLELPGVDLDLSLEEYARVICTMMDIPVYDNIAESLHVLFTLYMEFKSNQHFMGFGGNSGDKEEGPVGDNRFGFGEDFNNKFNENGRPLS